MGAVLGKLSTNSGHRAHLGGLAALLVLILAAFLTLDSRSNSTHVFAAFVSSAGNQVFIALGIVLLSANAFRRREPREIWLVLLVAAGITVGVQLLKLAVGWCSPRPSGSPGGFPSGHAAFAFGLAFMLSQRFPRLSVLWYAAAVAIAWSRLEMDKHYPYQVWGGAVLGLETAFVLRKRHLRRGALEPS